MRGADATEATPATDGPAKEGGHRLPQWGRYERLPDKTKAEATLRLNALVAVEQLTGTGTSRMDAYAQVAAQYDADPATLRRWAAHVRHVPRADWLPALAPGYLGRTATADCSVEAWDFFKGDYLRLEAPGAAACYGRLKRAAAEHGWTVPSLRTIERRIRREIPKQARVLARHGAEALGRLFLAQERDKTALHALECTNADGHKFDVFVRFPGGTVGRPCLLAWQDVHSGMIVSWRVDKTESAELVRLAFGDLVERYGIPASAHLDNGRGFASKWVTGGMKWRHRFKVKAEEPKGVLTALGVTVHWATPYHGQAKPIERAFKDLCETIAKHPANSGAYTGNKPEAKPEDYGSRAVPLADFLKTVESEINAHNTRQGRRSKVCQGRSFAEMFAESYAQAPIRKATAEQRRLWLLAAEGLRAQNPSGHVMLLGNRYWHEALVPYAGQPVVVRFDPQRVQEPVHVYAADGRYVCHAECQAAVGFADIAAAREHAKAKGNFRRATKAALAAERKLAASDVAAQLPDVEAPEVPGAKVVRLDFGRMALMEAPAEDANDAAFGRAVAMLEQGRRQGGGE
jgi:transposase InsO family protein